MRSAWCLVLLTTACASGAGPSADSVAPGNEAADPAASTLATTVEISDDTVAPASTTTAPPTTGTATSAPDTTTTQPSVPAVLPEGFDTTRAVVTTAEGDECDVCLWLADTSQQRSRGLMFVTDLGPADGMAFQYPRPHTGNFWMKNTPMPLSIAFFDPAGGFIDSFDMEPCATDACPSYATPRAFSVAVEVPQGELAGFGMVAGSRLELLDVPCDT